MTSVPAVADGRAAAGRGRRALTSLVLAPIRAYTRWVSPALPRRCKYEPTCSRYAIEAIQRFGILRGLALAAWRLLRCNPWSHGGFDPVGAQQVFRTTRRPRDPRPMTPPSDRSRHRTMDATRPRRS